jgi:hypothetical protein
MKTDNMTQWIKARDAYEAVNTYPVKTENNAVLIELA